MHASTSNMTGNSNGLTNGALKNGDHNKTTHSTNGTDGALNVNTLISDPSTTSLFGTNGHKLNSNSSNNYTGNNGNGNGSSHLLAAMMNNTPMYNSNGNGNGNDGGSFMLNSKNSDNASILNSIGYQ